MGKFKQSIALLFLLYGIRLVLLGGLHVSVRLIRKQLTLYKAQHPEQIFIDYMCPIRKVAGVCNLLQMLYL